MQNMRSLSRALELLFAMADAATQQTGGSTLVQLAQQVGLPPSTAHRLLHALEEHGLVRQPPDSREFLLGPRLMWLGERARQQMPLPHIALPIMRRLAVVCGESVTLNVLLADRRVCIQSVEGQSELRRVAEVGRSYSLHTGASAKVLLAFSAPLVQDRLVESFPADLVPDREELRRELEQIRQQCYSYTINERIEGLSALSRPVFNASSEVVAALSVSGPVSRFNADTLPALLSATRQAAAELSSLQGAIGDYPPKAG